MMNTDKSYYVLYTLIKSSKIWWDDRIIWRTPSNATPFENALTWIDRGLGQAIWEATEAGDVTQSSVGIQVPHNMLKHTDTSL